MSTVKEREKIIYDCYEKFHDPKYLEWDPLCVVRKFHGTPDEEWISWVAALFAFGGVKQIIKSLNTALDRLGVTPTGKPFVETLLQASDEETLAADLLAKLKGFAHRVYVDRDLVMILLLYRRSKLQFGSMEKHFMQFYRPENETIAEGLSGLVDQYRAWSREIPFQPGAHFKHMLNSPAQKSVCKRWVMFLKWVVRADDGIDLGLWRVIRPDQLVIPLDTHLFSISRRLKLTKKKTANWMTAVEVTRSLKKLDAADPLKFDFSLCRLGMAKRRTD
jgi:uncharacterized protein (TIGR02757 family)